MLLPSLLKSGDQVYQKVIKQLYQKMLLLNLLITIYRYLWTSAEQKIRDSVGKYRKKQSLPDDDSLTMELLS